MVTYAHWILVQKINIIPENSLTPDQLFMFLKPSHDIVPLFCLLTHIQHCNEVYRNIRHPQKICLSYKKTSSLHITVLVLLSSLFYIHGFLS